MGIIEKMRLDGKKGFVTGGARGIGKATATALAEAGADVAIVDMDIQEAEKTANWLASETGRDIFAIKADVTSPADVDAMIQAILARFGRIDFAHCNAGICINAPADEMTFEQWKKVIDVNLTGVFLTAQAAGKVMLKQGGGSIINTASMSGHIVNVPQPQCAYNASKAGVIGLTKSLARELARRNITANAVAPGFIATDMTDALSDAQREAIVSRIGSGRLGEPDDIAHLVRFLASDEASYLTGQVICVDGGMSL